MSRTVAKKYLLYFSEHLASPILVLWVSEIQGVHSQDIGITPLVLVEWCRVFIFPQKIEIVCIASILAVTLWP